MLTSTWRLSFVRDFLKAPSATLGWLGLIAFLLIVSLRLPTYADEPTYVLRARVLDVHDGDTIKVQLESGPISVRFHGIDAPELNQSHGDQSREALVRLVDNKDVDIEPTGQYSYERMVAVVYVGELNVNEQMIKAGEAWAARKYLRKTQDAEWCAYETSARELKRGLWSQPPEDWIDPHEWRYRKKRNYEYTDYSHETTTRCMAAIGK